MPGALAGATKLAQIDDVEIDSSGRFKYILCKVYEQGGNPATGAYKHVVRGTARAEFHSGIYDELDAQLEPLGLTCECLGGGRIEHNPHDKAITVFGTSQGFGRADHSVAADLLRKKYHEYAYVVCKDD